MVPKHLILYLLAMGNGDPLPPSSLAVQATLASLRAPDVHAFTLSQDKAAIMNVTKKVNMPLFCFQR